MTLPIKIKDPMDEQKFRNFKVKGLWMTVIA